MKRRRKQRGGRGIIKTKKEKCFYAFSSCFPMEKAAVSIHSVLQYKEQAWWDLELTTCVCLVTLVNGPNYPPPC